MDLTASNDRAVLGVSKSLLSGKKIRVSNADEKKDWAEVLSSVRKNSTKKRTSMWMISKLARSEEQPLDYGGSESHRPAERRWLSSFPEMWHKAH